MAFEMPLSQTRFCESVEDLLGRVECRPAYDAREREAIFRLRYAAYRRERALPPDAPEVFKDRFDDYANATTFGLYIDGALASSLRIHVVDRESPEHPGLHVFGDFLRPVIDSGKVLVDPTRFVVDAESSRRYPKLPYATVRVALMASEWFGADMLLATVRSEHQAFYKRLLGHRVVCDPRPYPTLSKPLSLMVLDFQAQRDRILNRYPFFASTRVQRQKLFGQWAKTTEPMKTGAVAMVA